MNFGIYKQLSSVIGASDFYYLEMLNDPMKIS